MKKIDKVILVLLTIEHLGFGLYGLYSPSAIASIIGYDLQTEFAYSEIRANYAMFTVLGFLAFFSIFFKSLMKQTYIIYTFIFSSLILGRILNSFLTGDMNTPIAVTILAELLVISLCIWRLISLRGKKEIID